MKKIIYAIIVIYHPDKSVSNRIRIIKQQVDRLLVIDNSPQSSHEYSNDLKLKYLHNNNKGGMAGALNRGITLAREENADFLFVFDQDTDLLSDFCDRMLKFALTYHHNNVGIFGPKHLNSATQKPVRLSAPGYFMCSCWPHKTTNSIECYFLINSCSLLNLRLIHKNYNYDENMALDMIDVDFGLRMRDAGILSVCNTEIVVQHGIGNRKIGGFALSPTNYTPNRKYLQARNRVLIWKLNIFKYTMFTMTDLIIWILDTLRTILFEDQRLNKIKSILAGVISGLKKTSTTNL